MTGLHLSHYAIESELGRGGMGIVFRAKDTKLNRTVALKVLPAGALASEDDRARFRREAQASAQLNHPNVCHVYEVDEAQPLTPDGQPVEGHMEPRLFIAMEYIDGETLHDYVKKGPLKLQEAVNIAGQVAEALKEAHAKQIVHRDIKSANIMLTEAGVAKVLDFGLAKTNQSTMLTRMGSTLGTVAYMSPEQARGQEVDGRSDLYSLGTVLYEMVAGRLPFSGDYEQAVLYGILNEAPEPLTAVRTGVPMQLEWIVDKLLKKEAEYRYQSAAGLLADLKSLDLSGSGLSRRSMPAMSAAGMAAVPGGGSGVPRWMWAALAGVALLAVAAGWFLKPDPPIPDRPVVRFDLVLESGLNRTGRRSIAISPDGKTLAFVASDGIVLRRMDNLGAAMLAVPGTSSRGIFFSPDSRWLAYEDTDNDWLMRIDLLGGSPVRVADLPFPVSGASWARNGDLFLGFGSSGMGRVPSAGGAVELLTGVDSTTERFSSPSLLPDGRTVVYSASTGGWEDGQLRLLDLESGNDRLLHSIGRDARYVSTGHVVYLWNNSLYALPFDHKRNQPIGSAAPVAQAVAGADASGSGQFDISDEGTLVSVRGTGIATLGYRLMWSAADGLLETLSSDERVYQDATLSPDASKVAVSIRDSEGVDIWIVDAASGVARRLTSTGTATSPTWRPDGGVIAYGELGAGILARDLANPEVIDTLTTSAGRPTSWSPDGRFLAFEAGPSTDEDIAYLVVETGEEVMFQETDADTQRPVFSPDGRWLAYSSDEDGEDQIFVRLFPSGGDRIRVSEGRFGITPRWSRDGSVLYYAGNGAVFASQFDPEAGVAEPPIELNLPPEIFPWAGFDVHPDGRILSPFQSETIGSESGLPVVDIVINFEAELKARAPGTS